MPELVSKKIREIIKNHVSLKSEIIEIHWKNNGFWWFRRLHVRTVKVSKKHQKWDQIPSEIQWKIDTKNMLEKREPKYENSSKKWSKNGAKIHQKSFPNRCEKRDEKWRSKTLEIQGRRKSRYPQTQSFQKTSFGVRCEESTLRKSNEGWVQSGVQKVKCKGKVQKGKCRRQVQKGKCRQGTHYAPKHARWLRPRADPSCKASPHRAGQGLWCWKGFGTEKCDFGNCASPHPQPPTRHLHTYRKTTKNNNTKNNNKREKKKLVMWLLSITKDRDTFAKFISTRKSFSSINVISAC